MMMDDCITAIIAAWELNAKRRIVRSGAIVKLIHHPSGDRHG